jgi:hypothetical protein
MASDYGSQRGTRSEFLRDKSLTSRTIECPLEFGHLGFEFIQPIIEFQDQLMAFRHRLGKFSAFRHRLSSHPGEPIQKAGPPYNETT